DLAATAECQVGALLFSVPMQNDAAPTWYRQISVAVPQLRRCFFMIAVDIQDSQYPEILRGYAKTYSQDLRKPYLSLRGKRSVAKQSQHFGDEPQLRAHTSPLVSNDVITLLLRKS
ncbi:MAG: hypothetical protein AAFS12_14735, partial [Cyanobacteria bacterium J06632_19]